MLNDPKILIIGGNAAGAAAAAKAKRVNPSASVIVFEAGEFISTGTCEIPYVLSGEIKDYRDIIFFTPEKFKEEKGAEVFINHHVDEILTKEKSIVVTDIERNEKKKYEYDKLIIAAGSVPGKIPSLPPTLKNVFNLTSVKDLILIQEFLSKNKVNKIGIAGAGYIGLETADALHQKGYEVTVIEKENLPMPQAEPEMRYLVLDQIKEKNISFYGGFNKMKVVYDDDKVSALNIDSRILHFDLIITSVGFKPDASLAMQAKLKTGRYGGITVDRKLKTSDQHIFAAGDCIEVINAVTNQYEYMPFASIAHEYGHAAGENAAGGNVTVEPVIKNSSVKIFDKYFVSAGLSAEEAKENNLLFDSVYGYANNLVDVMPQSEKTFGKIVFEKNSRRILGTSFFGGKETSGYGDICAALIKLKQPVDFLAGVNYNYTPPLSPMKNLLSVLGRKAAK